MRLSFKKRKEKKTDSSRETAQAYRNMHPMVRCVKMWTELNGIPRGGCRSSLRGTVMEFSRLEELVRELRKNTRKQASSPLDLIILKRETTEWLIALTGTGRRGSPLIYFLRCEKGGQRALSTGRHSSARGLNCTPGEGTAWHPGVGFRCGLCSVDTWRSDHLPWEKHGGIPSQQQRFMTIHSFPASK